MNTLLLGWLIALSQWALPSFSSGPISSSPIATSAASMLIRNIKYLMITHSLFQTQGTFLSVTLFAENCLLLGGKNASLLKNPKLHDFLLSCSEMTCAPFHGNMWSLGTSFCTRLEWCPGKNRCRSRVFAHISITVILHLYRTTANLFSLGENCMPTCAWLCTSGEEYSSTREWYRGMLCCSLCMLVTENSW